LVVWQRAMDLVVRVYDVTRDWPKDELYGLTSQARRSAVSVPANIAEGYGREALGAYINFLRMAQGSLKELETHIEVASRVRILEDDVLKSLLSDAESVGKLLRALIRKLEESN
jgi:four helix bundle protein